MGRGKAAKLTDEQAAEIRRQYEYGRKRKLILAEFHITYHALWQVVNGRTHKSSLDRNFARVDTTQRK